MQTEKDRMDLDSRIGTQRTIERCLALCSDFCDVSVFGRPSYTHLILNITYPTGLEELILNQVIAGRFLFMRNLILMLVL